MHQFQRLTAGLEDPAPAVRVAAINGICQILNVFWEMVPSATTAAYLKRLTGPEQSSWLLQDCCCLCFSSCTNLWLTGVLRCPATAVGPLVWVMCLRD